MTNRGILPVKIQVVSILSYLSRDFKYFKIKYLNIFGNIKIPVFKLHFYKNYKLLPNFTYLVLTTILVKLIC